MIAWEIGGEGPLLLPQPRSFSPSFSQDHFCRCSCCLNQATRRCAQPSHCQCLSFVITASLPGYFDPRASLKCRSFNQIRSLSRTTCTYGRWRTRTERGFLNGSSGTALSKWLLPPEAKQDLNAAKPDPMLLLLAFSNLPKYSTSVLRPRRSLTSHSPFPHLFQRRNRSHILLSYHTYLQPNHADQKEEYIPIKY